jgi:hypothetical protein
MNFLKFFLTTSAVAGHHYCNKNVDLHHYSVAVIFCLLLIYWQDFSLIKFPRIKLGLISVFLLCVHQTNCSQLSLENIQGWALQTPDDGAG